MKEDDPMPYLHLDLPGTYPVEVKRELATRLCMLYALVMETQRWRPNVGIAELGSIERKLSFSAPLDGAQRAKLAEICERTPVTLALRQGLKILTEITA
jgi:hypothetical protein